MFHGKHQNGESMDFETPQTPPPVETEPLQSVPDAPVKPVSFSDWLVTLIITLVPLLNLVMLILWATEQQTNPSKANWAKATLVVIAMQTIFMLFLIGAFIGSISGTLSELGGTGLLQGF